MPAHDPNHPATARWSTRRLAALLISAAFLAAACGGDDSDDDDGAPATGEESTAEQAGAGEEAGTSGDADRCDLGFNTATYNETAELVDHAHNDHAAHHSEGGADYSVEEWAEEFADESVGLTSEQLVDLVGQSPQLEHAVTSGGLTPTLDPDPWQPMTDPDECEALAAELRATREAIAGYPTVADALAAGYRPGSGPAPGQGAHYTRTELIAGSDGFDPAAPAQLMYDGTDDDSHLIGMAHMAYLPDGGPPEGFTGMNDVWHAHTSLCQSQGEVIGADMTEAECAALGGTLQQIGSDGLWMLHTWVVPGCESDWGMFSGANPDFPVVRPDADYASGCNSGMTVDDPLELDDPGDGPDI